MRSFRNVERSLTRESADSAVTSASSLGRKNVSHPTRQGSRYQPATRAHRSPCIALGSVFGTKGPKVVCRRVTDMGTENGVRYHEDDCVARSNLAQRGAEPLERQTKVSKIVFITESPTKNRVAVEAVEASPGFTFSLLNVDSVRSPVVKVCVSGADYRTQPNMWPPYLKAGPLGGTIVVTGSAKVLHELHLGAQALPELNRLLVGQPSHLHPLATFASLWVVGDGDLSAAIPLAG
eukprot:scaffold962_cov372-Prasinococcus_capsulatus_cf.AAC.8